MVSIISRPTFCWSSSRAATTSPNAASRCVNLRRSCQRKQPWFVDMEKIYSGKWIWYLMVFVSFCIFLFKQKPRISQDSWCGLELGNPLLRKIAPLHQALLAVPSLQARLHKGPPNLFHGLAEASSCVKMCCKQSKQYSHKHAFVVGMEKKSWTRRMGQQKTKQAKNIQKH